VRLGVIATVLAITAPAVADPVERLELTGFLGVEDLSKDIGLGNAEEPEQRPQTAPMFGARLTYIALQTSGDVHLDVGLEGELSVTTAWTGYGFDDDRASYFSPVIGFRANLLVRLGGGWLQPHLLAGGGGASVITSSPQMTSETDPVFAWGVGSTFDMNNGWQLRVDGRQLVSESMTGGSTRSYELLVAAGYRFGKRAAKPAVETAPTPPIVVENLPDPNHDTDGDGIVDRLDQCPQEAEVPNGIDDADGCPEPDPDRDGLVGAADRCPELAEDIDGFEDTDGCPDLDNDKDGIADASDKCPNRPETNNGIDDDDGCPDQVPAGFIAALASANKVTFDRNSVRVTSRAKAALEQSLTAMLANPKLKVLITAHPDADGERYADLAKKRAENVRWYLVEQGIPAAALTTAVGAVAKQGPVIVLSVAP